MRRGAVGSNRFRPGVAATIAMIAIVVMASALGQWQMSRARAKEALHHQAETQSAKPPVVVGAAPKALDEVERRRVVVRGEFLPATTIYLDNRTRRGIVGFEVVTALKVGDGSAVVVDRGWVPADPRRGRTAPAVEVPQGTVEIEGNAVAQPGHFLTLQGAVDQALGGIWANFAFDDYVAKTQLKLQPFVVLQTSASADGLQREWADPGSGAAKHWSYAAQWFAMALAAVAGWVWWGFKGARAPSKGV